MRTFFIILFLAFPLSLSGTPVNLWEKKSPPKSINTLVKKIREELPKGWTVSYEKENAYLAIVRNEATLSGVDVLNGFPDNKPELKQFSFSFRILPKLEIKKYHVLQKKNSEKLMRLHKLYQTLKKMRVDQKFDNFLPDTPEEKALVDQYETLKEALYPLPDFYYDDFSLKWIYGSPHSSISIFPVDEQIRKECFSTRKKIIKLFAVYPDSKKNVEFRTAEDSNFKVETIR